jgi:phage terminase large subunit-like protein
VDPSLSPALNSASVFLGVDLGVKSDSSAVVALGRDATGKTLVAAFHCVWRPRKEAPVMLDEVKNYIAQVHRLHHVQGVYADPSQCFLLIQQAAVKLTALGIAGDIPQELVRAIDMSGATLESKMREAARKRKAD